MSTEKFARACTGSRKWGSLPRLLAQRLKGHSYTQSKTAPGLWMHEWRPITFSLVVDNFGVKCIGEDHAQQLFQMVQKYYTCLFEKEGERYCGLTIKWDYAGQKVHLSKPSYVMNALKHFQHPPPIVLQDQRTHASIRHMAQKYIILSTQRLPIP